MMENYQRSANINSESSTLIIEYGKAFTKVLGEFEKLSNAVIQDVSDIYTGLAIIPDQKTLDSILVSIARNRDGFIKDPQQKIEELEKKILQYQGKIAYLEEENRSLHQELKNTKELSDKERSEHENIIETFSAKLFAYRQAYGELVSFY